MTKGYHDSTTKESDRDCWRTPGFIFNYYNHLYGFTTDVAASADNKLCRDYISIETNALESEWGDINFCNPPYSNIMPWVKKAIVQMIKGKFTLMLIPDDMSASWFKAAWLNCTEMHMINKRVAFINAETGNPVSGNNKGSVVFIFDPRSMNKQVVKMICRDEIKVYG